MKTFKDIINEVAEPKGGDEKRFKAKHVVAKYDHPIEDGAEENQFKGGTKKDKSKKASYEDGKDAEVYEGYASAAQRKAVWASRNDEKEGKKKKKSFKEMFSTQASVDEEVELDEAFKMGSMKLKDGSTVKLSKEEAEAVNELFNELNSSNKKRMEEEMMKNKSGFDKVLKFAKEAM